jgi:hypothetical protein
MIFLWLMVSLAGGVVQGATVTTATTTLTVALSDIGTVITVKDTKGFPDVGLIVIGDEKIWYSDRSSATVLTGSTVQPVQRGAESTVPVIHLAGAKVRTVENSMLNSALNYNISLLSDTSGAMAFITIPLAFLRLIGSFLILPLGFLGTNLQILTVIWGALSIGILVAIGIAIAGGRRV